MIARAAVLSRCLGSALALLAGPPAHAAGGANCTLSTTPLEFGQYVPSRPGPSDFTATLTIVCIASGSQTASVGGSISLINSGGPSGRELVAGQGRLRYQLFMDAARTIPWGDGGMQAKPISAVVGPATPWRQSFTIYGRILARQSHAPVGRYIDRITAVLNY